MSDEMHERVKVAAKMEGWSMALYIREAIKAQLTREQGA